jgi:Fe-S-cluster containining protein
MQYDPILKTASRKKKEYSVFIGWLKKKRPADLDIRVKEFHDAAFDQIDCLKCANCCSSISPAMYDKDIDKIAKALKIKPSRVVEAYLFQDVENDWVFRQTPCPFLGNENLCSIYESRPLACKEYPHTNRPRFYQVLDLTLKNALVCPAVCMVIADLREYYETRK